jgi:photosystem II stability/assembly factor-like uncharacterized protein
MLGSTGMLRSEDGGATWSVIRRESSSFDLLAITFLDRRNGWAVGDSMILHTRDGGDTWSSQDGGEGLRDVTFPTPNLGVAVGEMASSRFFAVPAIFRTQDGGAHWRPASLPDPKPNASLSSVCLTRTGTGIAVGGGSGGIPFAALSADTGSTWVDITDRLGPRLSHAACIGSSDVWVTGGLDAFHSTDGGTTWTDAASPILAVVDQSTDPARLDTIVFTDTESGWVGGATNSWFILHTVDGGATWTPQDLSFQPGAGAGISSIVFTPDGQHGIAASLGAANFQVLAFVTSDGGNAWTPSNIPRDPVFSTTEVGSLLDFAIVP